jgi:Na+/proline symporter
MTLLDGAIILVYMAVVVTAGLLSRGRQASGEDYFTAGGAMQGFLGTAIVGLSVAATFFSGITFVALPSVIISDGLKVLLVFGALVPSLFIVSYWFIPRYMAFGGLHPYAIVAVRLGGTVRAATSVLFILLRVGWMAALIYAPTIVILAMLGLGAEWTWPVILIVGLSATAYSCFAGLRGVMVTDAIQMLVIIGSLLLAVLIGLSRLPFDPSGWWHILAAEGKLAPPSFTLDFTERFTVWGVLIGISVSNLAMYMGDQMSLQRYLAMGTARAAQRAFFCNLGGVMGVLSMLFGIGIVVLLWHAYHPELPMVDSADSVFPAFVATILPPGLSGLMVAAILAATMSSISSGINALAGAVTIDFIQPARPAAPPGYFLVVGRWLSAGIGAVSTVGAGLAARLGTIYDVSQAILGVFLGPILGVLVLALLNRPVGQARVLVAILAASVCGIGAAFSGIQTIWVTAFGIATFFLIAGWRR